VCTAGPNAMSSHNDSLLFAVLLSWGAETSRNLVRSLVLLQGSKREWVSGSRSSSEDADGVLQLVRVRPLGPIELGALVVEADGDVKIFTFTIWRVICRSAYRELVL